MERTHHQHHRKHRNRIKHFLEFITGKFTALLNASAEIPFYGALVFMLLFSASYHGGGHWWLPAALAYTVVLYAIWFFSFWRRGISIKSLKFHPAMLLGAIPLAAGLIQLLPLGEPVKFLSPLAYDSWTSLNEIGIGTATPRLTMAPESTWMFCQLLILCLAQFFIIYNYGMRRRKLRLASLAVICTALVNAVTAYWQLLFRQTEQAKAVFTGVFANQNHFGFMMIMGILLAAGLLLPIRNDMAKRSPRFPEWNRLHTPVIFAIFLLSVALVLSLSRGAFLSCSLALALFFIIWIFDDKISKDSKKKFIAFVAVFLAALLYALQAALSGLMKDYQTLLPTENFQSDLRLDIWKYTLKMSGDFPLTGSGLGSFADVIQRYEPGNVTHQLLGHAHNDWLELMAETGWFVTAAAVLILIYLLSTLAKRLRNQQDTTLRWLGFSAFAAITACTVHECFDFNLKAMPNAMIFTALLAIVCSCANPLKRLPAPTTSSGWKTAPSLCTAVFLAFLVLPWQMKKVHAAVLNDKLRINLENMENPGTEDLKKLLATADKAQSLQPTSGRIKHRKALCAIQLAKRLPMEQAEEYWNTAAEQAELACLRFPNQGGLLLNAAEILEAADLALDLRKLCETQKLYIRAYECRPGLFQSTLRVANAHRRLYWAMLGDPDFAPKSDITRKRAMALYKDFIKLSPAQSPLIFPRLAELANGNQELCHLAQGNLPLQRQLIKHLVSKQNYELALQVLDENSKDWLNDDVAKTKILDRSLEWYGTMYTILGLAGKHLEQIELLPDYLKAADLRLEADIPPSPEKADNAMMKNYESAFKEIMDKPPRSWELILRYCQWLQYFGLHTELCTAMLPVTYGFKTPQADMLRSFQALLGLEQGEIPQASNSRDVFLAVALKVMIAEQTAPPLPAEAAQWIDALQDLIVPREYTRLRSPWLQSHLYPLYIGRIHAMLGNYQAAADFYRQSLALSPRNIITWNFLKKLPPEYAPDKVPEWAENINSDKLLHGSFTNGLALHNVKAEPAMITQMHQEAEITYTWICTGDNTEEFTVKTTWNNKTGQIYKDQFSFMELHNPVVAMKAGEVFITKRKWQPLTQTINSGKRIINSDYIANITLAKTLKDSRQSFKALPNATFPLLEVTKPE